MNKQQIMHETINELTAILVAAGIDTLHIDSATKKIEYTLSERGNERLIDDLVEWTEGTFMNLTHGHYLPSQSH